MAQSKGLVLITGINGYVASTAARLYIDDGYTVRGTARNPTASRELLHEVFAKELESGQLEIVEVKDITVPGAFDEAVKGVNVIAHLASPVAFSFEKAQPVIDAALKGTTAVYESALKFAGSSLKTVIQMSSVAAVVDRTKPAPYKYTEQNWNDPALKDLEEKGDDAGVSIYQASKVLAERAFWDFKKKNNPGWNFIAINPGFISGPPLNLPKDPAKIHETVIGIYHGLSGTTPKPLGGSGSLVDVRDVGRLLVFAADHPDKVAGRRLIAISGPSSPQKILDVLNEHYPQRKDIIPKGEPGAGYNKDGSLPEGASFFDTTAVPEITGQPWISVDKIIVDSAKAFERYL